MKRVEPRKVWHKLFGFSNGTLVTPSKWFCSHYKYLYIWFDHTEAQVLPLPKFVGIIKGRDPYNKGTYLVQWIADRRDVPLNSFFKWRKGLFEEVQVKESME